MLFEMFGINGRGMFFLAPDTGENASGGTGSSAGSESETEGGRGEQPSNATTPAEGQKPSWTSQLKEDLRSNKDLGGFKTISDLASAFLNLKSEKEKGVGKGENQGKEPDAKSVLESVVAEGDWNGFEAGLSKDSDAFGNIGNEFVKACKEKGVNPNIAKELLASVEKGASANRENHLKTSGEACIKALKDAWSDKYEENTRLMKLGYDKVFHDNGKALASFTKAGLGNHPLVCELFKAVGAMFKEPTPTTGTSGRQESDKDSDYRAFLARL